MRWIKRIAHTERHSHTHTAHGAHGHVGHGHASHGGVVHDPGATALAEHAVAYALAEPGPGGAVVRVDLEADEADWEFLPGQATRAWAFNEQVPGPTLRAFHLPTHSATALTVVSGAFGQPGARGS